MKTWNGSIANDLAGDSRSNRARRRQAKEPSAPSATPDRFVALALFDNTDGTLLPGRPQGQDPLRPESYGSRAVECGLAQAPNHLLVEKKPRACGA